MSPTPLHVVTGKGGTGKTTVAAALAMALAESGKRVLLCEVENRQGIARLFDVAPLPFEERKIAVGLGGEVYALAIEPEAALLEYLELYYKLGRAGRALDRFGVIDFATTIAPGVRDVLLTGKIFELASWRQRHEKSGKRASTVYDAIVLDAPPTGRITRFLNVSDEVAGIAKVGPIRKQADSIMEMMRAPTTRVHFVTILEEMPVQETLDGIKELAATGLNVGHVIVNQVHRALIGAGALDSLNDKSVGSALESVGLESAMAPDLLREGRHHLGRQRLQDEQRARLDDLDDLLELPLLPDGIDIGGLFELAESLREVAR